MGLRAVVTAAQSSSAIMSKSSVSSERTSCGGAVCHEANIVECFMQ